MEDFTGTISGLRDKTINLFRDQPAPMFFSIQLAVRLYSKNYFLFAYIATILYKTEVFSEIESEMREEDGEDEYPHHALMSYLSDLAALLIVWNFSSLFYVCVAMAIFQSIQLLAPKQTMSIHKECARPITPKRSGSSDVLKDSASGDKKALEKRSGSKPVLKDPESGDKIIPEHSPEQIEIASRQP